MYLSEFNYSLPSNLIAQVPIEPRDHSRLLILKRGNSVHEHRRFYDIADILGENDVLVVNNTRVIKARLKGSIEESEYVCEVFLHTKLGGNLWDCLVYPGKKMKLGKIIHFGNPRVLSGKIVQISEHGRIIEFNRSGQDFLDCLEQLGEIPLPPYIKEHISNDERYQTTYNKESGSVAAPTAGLHFTPELLERLEKKGVKIEKVLLHVGIGTFKSVEVENIIDHKMHTEYCEIQKDVAERLNAYKKMGKRIIAVGTTSVRTLESMSTEEGILEYGNKETNIFIYPGYKWKFVDSIISNFHLPKSTLLMLVSSFAGYDTIKKAYEEAIEHKYRFFSFGDAMWIQ